MVNFPGFEVIGIQIWYPKFNEIAKRLKHGLGLLRVIGNNVLQSENRITIE